MLWLFRRVLIQEDYLSEDNRVEKKPLSPNKIGILILVGSKVYKSIGF
jgi:hypothetical protein